MIAKDPHWICKLCFDRRLNSRYATLRRSDGQMLDLAASGAAKDKGKDREAAQGPSVELVQEHRVPDVPYAKAAQATSATSASQQQQPSNAPRIRPDQWKMMQDILGNRPSGRPWAPRDQATEMRRVDTYLQETDQWFYAGPDPPNNEQNITFENTETGERRVPGMVGAGHQVGLKFHHDFKERKRVSLEAMARTITNRLTCVEKGNNEFPIFQYFHGER